MFTQNITVPVNSYVEIQLLVVSNAFLQVVNGSVALRIFVHIWRRKRARDVNLIEELRKILISHLFYGMVANDHGFNDVLLSTSNKHLVYLYVKRQSCKRNMLRRKICYVGNGTSFVGVSVHDEMSLAFGQCSSKEKRSAEL